MEKLEITYKRMEDFALAFYHIFVDNDANAIVYSIFCDTYFNNISKTNLLDAFKILLRRADKFNAERVELQGKEVISKEYQESNLTELVEKIIYADVDNLMINYSETPFSSEIYPGTSYLRFNKSGGNVINLRLRAYPKNPDLRKQIIEQAKCKKAK